MNGSMCSDLIMCTLPSSVGANSARQCVSHSRGSSSVRTTSGVFIAKPRRFHAHEEEEMANSHLQYSAREIVVELTSQTPGLIARARNASMRWERENGKARWRRSQWPGVPPPPTPGIRGCGASTARSASLSWPCFRRTCRRSSATIPRCGSAPIARRCSDQRPESANTACWRFRRAGLMMRRRPESLTGRSLRGGCSSRSSRFRVPDTTSPHIERSCAGMLYECVSQTPRSANTPFLPQC